MGSKGSKGKGCPKGCQPIPGYQPQPQSFQRVTLPQQQCCPPPPIRQEQFFHPPPQPMPQPILQPIPQPIHQQLPCCPQPQPQPQSPPHQSQIFVYRPSEPRFTSNPCPPGKF